LPNFKKKKSGKKQESSENLDLFTLLESSFVIILVFYRAFHGFGVSKFPDGGSG